MTFRDGDKRDGSAWSRSALREVNREYRVIKEQHGPRYEKLCEIGSIATDSNRQTGKPSFGKPPSRPDQHVAEALQRAYGNDPGQEAPLAAGDLAIVAQSEDLEHALKNVLRSARAEKHAVREKHGEMQSSIDEWSMKPPCRKRCLNCRRSQFAPSQRLPD